MNDILKEITPMICDMLDVEADEVVLEASFQDDFHADSLDIVELIMAIEDVYNFDVADEDAETLQTVKDVVEYIKANKAN